MKPVYEMIHASLRESSDLVHGDREDTHGDLEENYTRAAALWTGFLGFPVSRQDVCRCMGLLKVARMKGGTPNDDDSHDAQSYFAIGHAFEQLSKDVGPRIIAPGSVLLPEGVAEHYGEEVIEALNQGVSLEQMAEAVSTVLSPSPEGRESKGVKELKRLVALSDYFSERSMVSLEIQDCDFFGSPTAVVLSSLGPEDRLQPSFCWVSCRGFTRSLAVIQEEGDMPDGCRDYWPSIEKRLRAEVARAYRHEENWAIEDRPLRAGDPVWRCAFCLCWVGCMVACRCGAGQQDSRTATRQAL